MKLLLAVSAGIDSMYLAERAPELFPGASFAVAHCNFSLRGAESDADEAFVRSWCAEHGRTCFVRRFPTREYAAQHGQSIEMAARILRYRWFGELCREHGFDGVAVAHHADDNAETLLLNLVRGTGLKGLCGMEEKRTLDGLTVLRPLLSLSRAQIQAWMQEHGCAWREDSSNASDAHARNRIRNEVIPVLKELNPALLETFRHEMGHFRQFAALADDWYEQKLNWATEEREGFSRVHAQRLARMSHRDYFLYRWTQPAGLAEETLSKLTRHLNGCFDRDGARTTGTTFSGRVFEGRSGHIRCEGTDLVLSTGTQHPAPEPLILREPGYFSMEQRNMLFSEFAPSELETLNVPEGKLLFDADALPFPLVVRPWRSGDWMRPLGMRGRKKLSDLFVDLGWTDGRKQGALVLAACDEAGQEKEPGHVLALLLTRIDDSVRVRPETKRILLLSEV